jgi:NAD(P)-dependent dehydrogenase (short-subunit alcohol dehydrogenase family)
MTTRNESSMDNRGPRTALITGAAQGIGRAFAQRLAADGLTVVVVDRGLSEETVGSIEANAYGIACDVTDEAAVAALRDEVVRRFGGVDVLVNNAMAYNFGPIEATSLADWRRVMTIGLDAPFLTSRAFLPGMRERGWGRIVNMTSNTLALTVKAPPMLPYITAKGGIVGFTRALASEVGADGITVNCIAPGLTKTPATEVSPLTPFEATAAQQAIPRTEVPADLVGTLSFLASDDAAFLTGQTLVVDGGLVHV